MGCQESQTMPQPHSISPEQQLVFQKDYENLEGEKLADMYFKNKEFLKAIETYQKVIEGGYKVDFDIEGLGNSDHAISRYEWFTYRWYDDQRKAGKFKGNVFDALSLCYCHIRCTNNEALEKGIIWYEDVLSSHQCYELYIGYANILYHKCRYEEALKYYKKVIALKPNIINNYVSIAMLSQYRRIQKAKSMDMAKKILEMDENNMYAHYILARNETNPDEKITKLKVVSQKFPDYVRATNDVGIAYGAKKEHEQARRWYKKCIEIAPQYAAAHNNVGVRTELLKEYEDALVWYLKACELDPQYKAAHGNAIDIFDHLKYTDDQILEQAKKYPGLKAYYFYYYLGLAYYDKNRVEASITWYKRAELLNNTDYELFNSIGISYDQIKDYTNAQVYYLKCIQLNPKYHNPYYNLGYLFKSKNNIDKAIEWYKKAIEVNPRYHKCYNNLGNIYKDRGQYQEAVNCYKKAVESHSTYTLALVNLAVCYIGMEMYQQAFPCFEKAKEILPTDNNGMSQSNKRFLNDNIALFDKEGQKWRKTGSIGFAEKQQLRALIKSFESNFKQIYSVLQTFKRKDQVVLKPQILRILRLIHEDKFQLKNIDTTFALVKHVFKDNEEYFHIVPQLFIQHFWTQYQQNKPILEIESNLFKMIAELSKKESSSNVEERPAQTYDLNVKMKNFNPPSDAKVNLFKERTYFNSYETLYSELVKINKLAEQSLAQFVDFVENVRKRSNGIPYGVNMKLPKRPEQQFKVILRILQKMFKKEINAQRVSTIIQKIEKQLRAGGKKITLLTIVHEIMDVWTQQITLILKERTVNKVETTCGISDLVRGKIMFDNIEDLRKAIDACDKLCHLRGYEIIELDNRLTKPQTMDVVLKIKVNEAICEFQLAMRQDQSKYHFIHSIYEIERSPLGCIFGSYLFMSKGFNYPILANCKDIEERLKTSAKEEDKEAVEAARYIISCLEEKEQTA